jgi:hypothetical protein
MAYCGSSTHTGVPSLCVSGHPAPSASPEIPAAPVARAVRAGSDPAPYAAATSEQASPADAASDQVVPALTLPALYRPVDREGRSG